MKNVKVTLVIENLIYREGIATLLGGVEGISVDQMFNAAEPLLNYLTLECNECEKGGDSSSRVDVIIIDSHLGNILSAVQEIKQLQPALKIILMAGDDDSFIMRECVTAGVEGLVTSNDNMGDLKNCIMTIHSGRLCYPADVSCILLEGLLSPSGAKGKGLVSDGGWLDVDLTLRQVNVLQLIEQGCSNKMIAKNLDIQLATVKNHVHQILERLNVKSRGEAASVYRRASQRDSVSII